MTCLSCSGKLLKSAFMACIDSRRLNLYASIITESLTRYSSSSSSSELMLRGVELMSGVLSWSVYDQEIPSGAGRSDVAWFGVFVGTRTL